MRPVLCPAGLQSEGDCVWIHKGLRAPWDDSQVGMGHPEQWQKWPDTKVLTFILQTVSVHHQDFQPFLSQLKLRCSQYESLMETVFSIIKISSLSDQRMSTARAVSFVWWQIVTILPRKKGSELRGGCCRKAPVFQVFNVQLQDYRSCPFRRRCKLDLTQWLSQQLLLLLLLSCMFSECSGRTDHCEGGVLWASGLQTSVAIPLIIIRVRHVMEAMILQVNWFRDQLGGVRNKALRTLSRHRVSCMLKSHRGGKEALTFPRGWKT